MEKAKSKHTPLIDALAEERDDKEYMKELRENYIKRMESQGNRIVFPADNELQIDVDNEEQYKQFKNQWVYIFSRDIPESSYVVEPSKGGLPGRHITVTLPFKVTSVQRIAFQAVLGSDPVRELLSLIRDYRGDEHPTLFCEKGKQE